MRRRCKIYCILLPDRLQNHTKAAKSAALLRIASISDISYPKPDEPERHAPDSALSSAIFEVRDLPSHSSDHSEMTTPELLPSLTAIILAAILSACLIWAIKPWLLRHALAKPNARSSHRVPTPQGAGVAVTIATLAVAGAVIAWAGSSHANFPAAVFGATAFIALRSSSLFLDFGLSVMIAGAPCEAEKSMDYLQFNEIH